MQLDYWYWQIGLDWTVYRGRQAIWASCDYFKMLAYLHEHNIKAEHRPFTIVVAR